MKLIDSRCQQKLGRPQQARVTQSAKSHIHFDQGQADRRLTKRKQHLKLQ